MMSEWEMDGEHIRELERQLAERTAEVHNATGAFCCRHGIEARNGEYPAEMCPRCERDALRADLRACVEALMGIVAVGGNLPDERLISRTGPNDAVHRGLMYCDAREIAREMLAHLGVRALEEKERRRNVISGGADLQACAEALQDLLAGGVEFDDERLKYKTIQLDRRDERTAREILSRPGVRAALGAKKGEGT